MSSAGSSFAVREYLPLVRRLMQGMSTDQRRDFQGLWQGLRNTLNEQQELIGMLQAALEENQGTALEPPLRPSSSASVTDIRAVFDLALADMPGNIVEPAATIRVISSLPANFLRQVLDGARARGEVNELGCWFSTRSPSHKGYVKVNLRNTLNPRTRVPIGVMVYQHQAAIVADGRGWQLTGASVQVSHLCHNCGCFNPRHLVVEPKELNLLRNSCQGKYVLVAPDKTTIHLCDHWNWQGGNHRHCILPRLEIGREMAGKWLDCRAQGGVVVRTGRSEQGEGTL
jgi:hypothetical protein